MTDNFNFNFVFQDAAWKIKVGSAAAARKLAYQNGIPTKFNANSDLSMITTSRTNYALLNLARKCQSDLCDELQNLMKPPSINWFISSVWHINIIFYIPRQTEKLEGMVFLVGYHRCIPLAQLCRSMLNSDSSNNGNCDDSGKEGLDDIWTNFFSLFLSPELESNVCGLVLEHVG